MEQYPEKIIVDLDVQMHLQHTDEESEKHSTKKLYGQLTSYPNKGDYHLELNPCEGDAIFFWPIIPIIIFFLFDWPTPAQIYRGKRKTLGLPGPQNFLDLSDGEYAAITRLNFSEDEYAIKQCKMEKVEDCHYKATIDTLHRYNSTIGKGMVQLLPADITMTDAGPGQIIGHTMVNWLMDDGSVFRRPMEIVVELKDRNRRLPMTEVYTYAVSNVQFAENSIIIDARGQMIAVDCLPTMVKFDKEKREFIE